MAAFMLVGAKLGDIWGRDRAFAIGLAVYGLGSSTTALSPHLSVLLVGPARISGVVGRTTLAERFRPGLPSNWVDRLHRVPCDERDEVGVLDGGIG